MNNNLITAFLRNPISYYGSSLEIPDSLVGKVCEDRSAVIGKNNWLFIYEGSNNYKDAYHAHEASSIGLKWAKLVEARQNYCDRKGINFLQVIVPNKATVMPENFPEDINPGITFALKAFLDAEPGANTLIPINQWRLENVRDYIFRRNDSHLALGGNSYLTQLIVAALGLEDDLNYLKIPAIETKIVEHTGDLGGKFNDIPGEKLLIPDWTAGFLNLGNVSCVRDVKTNHLVGIEQEIKNVEAICKKRVLVFGNSFMERVPSWGVSPYLASIFSDYYFIWSPSFDVKTIEHWHPDIVIAQTCERFLGVLPVDSFT